MSKESSRTSSQLLTVSQAEELTGRKASTWRKDILLRRVPYVRLGQRSVRIPREVIDRMIEEGWRDPVEPEEAGGRAD